MDKIQALELLRSFELLKEVPENQLEWLIEKGEIKVFSEDHPIFKPGDPIDEILFVLEGTFKIFANGGNQEQVIAEKTTGEISGFLPFSRAKTASGVGRVMERTTILCVHKSFEREMLRDHYELSQVLVHEMTSRVREFTSLRKQTEKMAALGKLAAGLAHELNNPASAIVRSSLELKKHLKLQPEKFKKVIKIQLTDDTVDQINDILFAKLNQQVKTKSLLENKQREEDIAYLLEDWEVNEPWELAENLMEVGFEEADVLSISKIADKKDLGPILQWISDNLLIERMVNDIQESSARISSLVNSVKVYTYMDQGQQKSKADLHEGIQSTLNMLQHKVKASTTKINLDFEANLPEVPVIPSELNQVWTNLLDNAIDAVAAVPKPEITIKTWVQGKDVKICIVDNGNGIPEDMLGRIWEPFFTTKAVGQGTGLGLELVQNIIQKHQGTIHVKSKPGSTTFEVCLPLQ